MSIVGPHGPDQPRPTRPDKPPSQSPEPATAPPVKEKSIEEQLKDASLNQPSQGLNQPAPPPTPQTAADAEGGDDDEDFDAEGGDTGGAGGDTITCPHCGLPCPANATRCPNCDEDPHDVHDGPSGSAAEKGNAPGPEKGNADMVRCATCNELRPRNSETCPHCGMK